MSFIMAISRSTCEHRHILSNKYFLNISQVKLKIKTKLKIIHSLLYIECYYCLNALLYHKL